MTAGEQRDAVARVRAACGELSLDEQLETFQIAWLISASLVRGDAMSEIPDEFFSASQTEQLLQLQDMSDDVARDFPDRAFVRFYEAGNPEIVWQEHATKTRLWPAPVNDSPGDLPVDAETLLTLIRRSLDAQGTLIERGIQDAADDRAVVNALRQVRHDFTDPDPDDVVQFHKLALQLIDDREALAKELEAIRVVITASGVETKGGV